MQKKYGLLLMLALTLPTTIPCCSLGKDNVNAPLAWEVTRYKTPFFGLDRVYKTVYHDSIQITLDFGETEPPVYFNLYTNKPYQFLTATFDSSGQILTCIFQEGIKFPGPKNSQWPGSLLRFFLSDGLNTANLKNEKVALLLQKAFDYLERDH